MVCTSCRIGRAADLSDLGVLYLELVAEADPVDPRATEDLARLLPMGIVQLSHQARVSGTREQPAPVNLDRLDLAGGARQPGLTAAGRAHEADQIGYDSIAARLDQWVRDWRDTLFPDESLPLPTVPMLVAWLSARFDIACDRHSAIDDFTTEIGELRLALRRVLGLIDAPPERCEGVHCRVCDRLNTIYKDGPHIQCRLCAHYYSQSEYEGWVGMLYADTRQRLRDGDLEMPDSVEVRRMVA